MMHQSITMDQTVNIPFSHKLEPGDSEFTIEVLSRFRDNPNRLFGFSSVTLCPDYFSKKAYKLDMDSERELKAVVRVFGLLSLWLPVIRSLHV